MVKEKDLDKLTLKTPESERKYRVGSTFKMKNKQGEMSNFARMLTYIDARYVQDKLDQIVGVGNWSNSFYRDEKGILFCTITITFEREDGKVAMISKTDCGTESNVEQQKGEVSDAFKRCAVHFGIARDLYIIPKDPWSMVAELDHTGKYLKDKNWKPKK